MHKRILILDNSSVLAMRVKVLLELIGCDVDLSHYSDFEYDNEASLYEVVIVAAGVPLSIVQQLKQQAISQLSFILLAPNSDSGVVQTSFMNLHNNLEQAAIIHPFYSNKEIIAIFEDDFELGEKSAVISLPKIMLVDDNVQRLRSIELSLKGAHIDVTATTHFDTAVGRAALNKIDILISDFNMGEFTGIDVFRQVKQLNPECRCLLVTSKPHQSALLEAIQLGVDDVIEKPLDEGVLLQAVYKIWQNVLLQRKNDELVARLQDTVDALIEKDSLIRVIYKNTPDAIVIFKQSGILTEANDSFLSLFHIDHKKISSTNLFDLIDEVASAQIKLGLEQFTAQFTCDLSISKKGHFIPLSGAFTEIDVHGEAAYAAIFRNVAHLKHKEEVLEESKSYLKSKWKLEPQSLSKQKIRRN